MSSIEELEAKLAKQDERISQIFEDFEQAKHELKDVKHKLANVSQQLQGSFRQNEELQNQMAEIITALKGNEFTGEKGMLARIVKIEEFIIWFNNKKAVATGYSLGIAAVVGAATTIIIVIKWLINHFTYR